MNKVLLTGRITKDVELRQTQSGISNVSFSIAVDRGFKDANGERQADFINCVAWRQQAEFLANYVKKGYMLAVEGQIQTRNYQNNQGQTIYVTEVICDRVENLTPKESQEERNTTATYPQPSANYVDDKNLPF